MGYRARDAWCTHIWQEPPRRRATYKDNIGTANTNPVVLDSSGSAVIYFAAQSYKLILQTSFGVPIWTQDNILGSNLPLFTTFTFIPASYTCGASDYSVWFDSSSLQLEMCTNGVVDTVAGLNTAETFLNKTLTSPTINGGTLTSPTINGGTATLKSLNTIQFADSVLRC